MEKKTLSFGSSLVAVILSLGTIIVGKLWLSLNTTIVLLLSATVVSVSYTHLTLPTTERV